MGNYNIDNINFRQDEFYNYIEQRCQIEIDLINQKIDNKLENIKKELMNYFEINIKNFILEEITKIYKSKPFMEPNNKKEENNQEKNKEKKRKEREYNEKKRRR